MTTGTGTTVTANDASHDPGQRYFVARDGSGHWYLVPQSKRAEWDEWRDLRDDDERSWEHPGFANPINGSPELLTFSDPKVG